MIKKTTSGFTLIELLVVIAIIGLLSSVILASLNTARQKAENAAVLAQAHQVQVALQLYYDENGGYPNPGTTNYYCIGGTTCTTPDGTTIGDYLTLAVPSKTYAAASQSPFSFLGTLVGTKAYASEFNTGQLGNFKNLAHPLLYRCLDVSNTTCSEQNAVAVFTQQHGNTTYYFGSLVANLSDAIAHPTITGTTGSDTNGSGSGSNTNNNGSNSGSDTGSGSGSSSICSDWYATNYGSYGSCYREGCTDPSASNYDPLATQDYSTTCYPYGSGSDYGSGS